MRQLPLQRSAAGARSEDEFSPASSPGITLPQDAAGSALNFPCGLVKLSRSGERIS